MKASCCFHEGFFSSRGLSEGLGQRFFFQEGSKRFDEGVSFSGSPKAFV
jgi:hypothetical protein